MRQPHIFQIGSTNYTTREYCQSKGITDDNAIKKIQWRINTYIRNHPVRDTTEELIRLVSFSTVTSNAAKEIDSKDQVYELTPSGRRFHRKCSQYHEPSVTCQDAQKDPLSDWRQSPLTPIQDLMARIDRQEETSKTPDGIRPWQGTKKEREIAQKQKEAREAATRKMITQQHNGETETREFDQRELLKQRDSNPLRTSASRETLESMLGAEDPRLQSFGKTETTEFDQRELLKQSKWMEHNEKWLNEAGILPNAEDIQKANKPPIIQETNITNAPDRIRAAYRSLKLYANAIEKKKTIQYKIDTLEAELKDAQKEVEKWSTNAAALLQDV